jgi:hypothetical protein
VVSLIIVLEKGKIVNMIIEDLQEACADIAKTDTLVASDIPRNTTNTFKLCPLDYCTSNKEGECDIKLFLSWMGTDKDGTALISSGDRFMNFKNYNLAGMYQSILQISNRESADVDEPYNPKDVNSTILARVSNPPKVVTS